MKAVGWNVCTNTEFRAGGTMDGPSEGGARGLERALWNQEAVADGCTRRYSVLVFGWRRGKGGAPRRVWETSRVPVGANKEVCHAGAFGLGWR